MKRLKFLKYLKDNDCFLEREGGRHSIFTNKNSGEFSAVPRHPDINEQLKLLSQLNEKDKNTVMNIIDTMLTRQKFQLFFEQNL